jgi:hypothetical protein
VCAVTPGKPRPEGRSGTGRHAGPSHPWSRVVTAGTSARRCLAAIGRAGDRCDASRLAHRAQDGRRGPVGHRDRRPRGPRPGRTADELGALGLAADVRAWEHVRLDRAGGGLRSAVSTRSWCRPPISPVTTMMSQRHSACASGCQQTFAAMARVRRRGPYVRSGGHSQSRAGHRGPRGCPGRRGTLRWRPVIS